MSNGNSIYFLLACILVGAMGVVGLGLLFVRAVNIERRNLVAGTTLCGSLVAMVILWFASRHGMDVPPGISMGATAIAIVGFAAGRMLDVSLGRRSRVHRDEATLGADLAD